MVTLALDLFLVALILRGVVCMAWTAWIVRRLHLPVPQEYTLSSGRRLVLLLPVFRETGMIAATIQYLTELTSLLGGIEVWVIGTARERDAHGRNPTLEMARRCEIHNPRIRIVEDPRKGGSMAHQINFAIELLRREPNACNTWLFLLNIDSRITQATLGALFYLINRGVHIVQQSALFLGNYHKLSWLMRGFAIWQSRWTLAHEMRRIAMYRAFRGALVHVVGHGLCISLHMLERYRGLPEDTITEDLHLGLYLGAHGEVIEWLPILEQADSPTSLREVLKQKYVWSFGPLLYPKYLLLLRSKFRSSWPSIRMRAFLQCFQGVVSYISWASVSWVLILLLIASLSDILAAAALLVYLGNYVQCILYFRRNHRTSSMSLPRDLLATLVAGLFHSAPANVALLDVLTGRAIVKHKTHHE